MACRHVDSFLNILINGKEVLSIKYLIDNNGTEVLDNPFEIEGQTYRVKTTDKLRKGENSAEIADMMTEMPVVL